MKAEESVMSDPKKMTFDYKLLPADSQEQAAYAALQKRE